MRSRGIYLPNVDAVRGMAALLVLAGHVFDYFPSQSPGFAAQSLLAPIAQGHVGVGIFFVLSGFILTYLLYDKPFSMAEFLLNRVTRLYPLFFFFVVLETCILLWQNVPVAADALFLKLLSPVTYYVLPTLLFNVDSLTPVFWSVCVEFQCYILVPFLIVAMRDRPVTYAVGIWAFMTVLRAGLIFQSQQNVTHLTVLDHLDQFVIGMAVGILAHRLHRLPVLPWWASVTVALLGVITYHHLGGPTSLFAEWLRPSLEGPLAALLMWSAISVTRTGRFAKAMCWCGTLSYSVYGWHFILLHGLRHWWPDLFQTNWVFATAALLAVTLPASWLTYKLIERPALRLRRRFRPAQQEMVMTGRAAGSGSGASTE